MSVPYHSAWIYLHEGLPPPLEDVMAAYWCPIDQIAYVYPAYRKPDGRWCMSGVDVDVELDVYAWMPLMEPPAAHPTFPVGGIAPVLSIVTGGAA